METNVNVNVNVSNHPPAPRIDERKNCNTKDISQAKQKRQATPMPNAGTRQTDSQGFF